MSKKYKFKFTGEGLTEPEIKKGTVLLNDYVINYPHLNKLSTLQLLEDLVYLEMMQSRIKREIGDSSKDKRAPQDRVVPKQFIAELQENLEQILKLKEKLGLFETKEKLDAYKDIDNLKKKFKVYRENHPLSFKTTCPFCKEIYFMKRRTKDYEPHITPFFENKILVNRPLFKLYHEGKITKKDVAAVLGVSEDYVPWVEEKILNKIKSA